jgi:Universal stress protein family
MTHTQTHAHRDAIVVGFSNSAVSAAALRWAVAEGARVGCQVHVVHVYDEAEHADARLEGVGPQGAPPIDPSRVMGALGDAPPEARVTVTQERGGLEDTLGRACVGARMLVIGKPGDCRHRGLEDRLKALVDCPVVPVPLV